MVCCVHVMSFNVRGASHMGDGVNVWERRAAIRRYEPDLIGFQEFHHGNEDDAYTFHAFKGARFTPSETDKPTGRIDWILVRDEAGRVKISSHEILRDGDEAAGTYPSDHYPVLAELELTG